MDVFANNAMWQKAFHMAELMHQHSVHGHQSSGGLDVSACTHGKSWNFKLEKDTTWQRSVSMTVFRQRSFKYG